MGRAFEALMPPGVPMPPDALEFRARAGARARIKTASGEIAVGSAMSGEEISRLAERLLRHSVYAWEDELLAGFFTLDDGSRAGIAGRYSVKRGEIAELARITSVCVRNAREIIGCAEPLGEILLKNRAGVIILSPPGVGKTTLLRDAARMMSEAGLNVAIADERCEIAASGPDGPTFDLGPRTDVMDMCPKALAIPRLVRSMSPDAIVADEIGGPGDAEAALDAARCGVKLVTSAHAASLLEALGRRDARRAIESGAFAYAVELGDAVGAIREIRRL